MQLIDFGLAASSAAAILSIVQVLKVKKPFDKIDGEVLSLAVGVAVVLIGLASAGKLTDANEHIQYAEVVKGAATGVVGGLIASGAFNIQDLLPFQNLLASRSDKLNSPSAPAPATTVVNEGEANV